MSACHLSVSGFENVSTLSLLKVKDTCLLMGSAVWNKLADLVDRACVYRRSSIDLPNRYIVVYKVVGNCVAGGNIS